MLKIVDRISLPDDEKHQEARSLYKSPLLLEQLHGESLVLLGERGVSYDVRKHYRNESPLAFRHYGPLRRVVGLVIKRFARARSGSGGA